MKKRPLSLTIAALLLILSVVASVAFPLITGSMFRGAGFGGNFQGAPNGQDQQDPGQSAGGGGRVPRGGSLGIPGLRIPGIGGLGRGGSVLGIAFLIGGILVGLGMLVAAGGLWQAKKWAFILALIVSVLGVGLALQSLWGFLPFLIGPATPVVGQAPVFLQRNNMIWANLVPTGTRILLMLAVFVLVLLPSSRRAYN